MPSSQQPAAAIIITCGRGCVPMLQKELAALGYASEPVSHTSVETHGTLSDTMRMNLWLRTAHRILWEVSEFKADDVNTFYKGVKRLPWENWLPDETPFHVHGVVQNSSIRDSRFAVLRCKDAIADHFMERYNRRPDSLSSPSGAACIAFYWMGRIARVFLDTTGTPLSHRGYRLRPWMAPLRETLAAAILLEAGFTGQNHEAFIGPMCGSGTLAIEAAWIAQNRAPGLLRHEFAFMYLLGVEENEWKTLRQHALDQLIPSPKIWIAASDINAQAILCARENAEKAGVADLIRFHTCEFQDTPLPKPPAMLLLNPEYGERMGIEERLAPTYEAIGDFFKQHCQGMRAFVFTGNIAMGREIGLKPKRRTTLYNGDIECRLLEYELYEGTRDERLKRKHETE